MVKYLAVTESAHLADRRLETLRSVAVKKASQANPKSTNTTNKPSKGQKK